MVSLDALEHLRRKYADIACDHCGRKGRVAGSKSRPGEPGNPYMLCHANPDGSKADPDCYHLVTVYGEEIGSRKPVTTHEE